MKDRTLSSSRRVPFAAASLVLVVTSLALAVLPETWGADLRRRSPFTPTQATWALYLAGAAAVLQAVYEGFAVLRPHRIEAALQHEERLARLPATSIASAVARNAAIMTSFTLLYGIALVALTGRLGWYVPFALLAAFQGAWYYRAAGVIAEWLARRPAAAAPVPTTRPRYCPPLARGLSRGP